MHSKLCSPTRCSKSKALFSKETSVKQAKCFELRRRLVHGPAARSRKRPKLSSPKQSKRISRNLSALHDLDTRFQLLGGGALNSEGDWFTGPLPEVESVRSTLLRSRASGSVKTFRRYTNSTHAFNSWVEVLSTPGRTSSTQSCLRWIILGIINSLMLQDEVSTLLWERHLGSGKIASGWLSSIKLIRLSTSAIC